MGALNQNTTAAERAVGASFGERFRSSAAVVQNGGTVFGTPTFDDEAILNGTTDYIKYLAAEAHTVNIANSGSIYCRFRTLDVSQVGYLMSSTNSPTDKWGLLIASGSVLFRYVNAARTRSMTTASLQNGKWHDVVVCYDGATRPTMYVDAIEQAGTAGASLNNTVSTTVGASPVNSTLFGGIIDRLEVFRGVCLTQQEAADFFNNNTYNYRNQATLDLPLLDAQHTAGVGTDDVSPGGNTITFGAGAAEPTKTTARGYLFDGVDDNFDGLPALSGDFTVMVFADNIVTHYNDSTVYDTIGASGGFSGQLHGLQAYGSLLTDIQKADSRIAMLRRINQL